MISAAPALSTTRKLVLVCAALAVALSWLGSLDRYSQDYLDDALVSGGLVYATARGINAAVSVLQGTEITPAVATFTVGEVLDPVNDLIERFSGMLLLALGSLALQKILLEIFSHTGFSILVSLLGARPAEAQGSDRISRLVVPEVGRHLAGGGVAPVGVLLHRLEANRLEVERHAGVHAAWWLGILRQDPGQDPTGQLGDGHPVHRNSLRRVVARRSVRIPRSSRSSDPSRMCCLPCAPNLT